jgi:hypothetical protein
MNLESEIPSWSIGLFAVAFWLLQHYAKPMVRLWALITLPATFLHELAHGLVGLLLAAQPSSFNLWPRRVSASSWRLGYVGFNRLRWWNGGAVALAPLVWLIVLFSLTRVLPVVPEVLSPATSIVLGIGLIWLWIAVAPSRSDWRLAFGYWPSALVFLALWGFTLSWIAQSWLERSSVRFLCFTIVCAK